MKNALPQSLSARLQQESLKTKKKGKQVKKKNNMLESCVLSTFHPNVSFLIEIKLESNSLRLR